MLEANELNLPIANMLISGIVFRLFTGTFKVRVVRDEDCVSLEFKTLERDTTLVLSYEQYRVFRSLITSTDDDYDLDTTKWCRATPTD